MIGDQKFKFLQRGPVMVRGIVVDEQSSRIMVPVPGSASTYRTVRGVHLMRGRAREADSSPAWRRDFVSCGLSPAVCHCLFGREDGELVRLLTESRCGMNFQQPSIWHLHPRWENVSREAAREWSKQCLDPAVPERAVARHSMLASSDIAAISTHCTSASLKVCSGSSA